MSIDLLYLSRADVVAAGAEDWRRAVDDVRDVTLLLARGEAGMVEENVLPMGPDPREKAYGLPAFVAGPYDVAGLKWAVHRAAPAAEMPSIVSATFVNRLSDGRPLGLVESALLTRMRTAAVSAIAMQSLLSAPPRGIAVVGAGAQARAHLAMLAALFPGVPIALWNRTREHAEALAAHQPSSRAIQIWPDLAGAIADADVVLTCTSSPEPLLDAAAVRPGRLIVQIGFHEVSFEAIAASTCVAVDLWGRFAQTSAKSLFQMYRAGRFDPAHVAADLPALASGWRPEAGASLYFSSFGLNVFDIAIAGRLLAEARARGLGASLPFL